MRTAEEERILRYHERTKHHPGRFARSLGYLDWDTQPDPFRRHPDAPLRLLPLSPPLPHPLLDEVLAGVVPAASKPLDEERLSALLRLSFGISAVKEYQGQRWCLRVPPSSGNLHPVEAHLGLPMRLGGEIALEILHYRADLHALEERGTLRRRPSRALLDGLPKGSFFLGLSSITWREAWKYGERALRYTALDVGHALAAASLAAAAFGYRVLPWPGGLPDDHAARCMALPGPGDAVERERAEAWLAVVPRGTAAPPRVPRLGEEPLFARGPFGTPQPLSPTVVPWPVVEEAGDAAEYRGTAASGSVPATRPRFPSPPRPARFAEIALRRRSAQALDGATGLERATFLGIARALRRTWGAPSEVLEGPPLVVPVLLAHRVSGIDPGVYVVPRGGEGALEALLSETGAPSLAASVAEDDLRLLRRGDVRGAAALLACGQAIAGDGAFSCVFLADLEEALRRWGAFGYRRVHAEAGLLGHVLYLEAEAAGLRGTGIGCFFDDETHRFLGLRGRRFQSVYHFTVGAPLVDARLRSIDPMDEVQRLREEDRSHGSVRL